MCDEFDSGTTAVLDCTDVPNKVDTNRIFHNYFMVIKK